MGRGGRVGPHAPGLGDGDLGPPVSSARRPDQSRSHRTSAQTLLRPAAEASAAATSSLQGLAL